MEQRLSLKVTLTTPGTTINHSATYIKEYSALGFFPKLIVVGVVGLQEGKSEIEGYTEVVDLNFEVLVAETGYPHALPVIFYLLNPKNYPVYRYSYKEHPTAGKEPEWHDIANREGMRELHNPSCITRIRALKLLKSQSIPLVDSEEENKLALSAFTS